MRKPVLSETDSRAVDLFLNHACGVTAAGHCDPVPHQLIEAVRCVLSNLDKMPPIEPPIGLVRRTMGRIDRVAGAAFEHAEQPIVGDVSSSMLHRRV